MRPPHFPQRIVGFRRSAFPQMTQAAAVEEAITRRRWWMGESRSGGDGRRRKLKDCGRREIGEMSGGEGRTMTDERGGRGGGGGGMLGRTGGDRVLNRRALDGVA